MTEDGYGNLGFYTMAILHLFICIGSMISTAIMNKIGVKACLFIGSFTQTLWAFSSILAALGTDDPSNNSFYT
jgi:hypothetical protein